MKHFFKVKGNAYERALQQGRIFSKQMTELLGTLREAFSLGAWFYGVLPKSFYAWFLKREGRQYFRRHEELVHQFRKGCLVHQIRGLSEGLKQEPFLIYGLNCVEILASKIPYTLGCTSLAFSSEGTRDGHPKIGYNHDFPEAFGRYLFVRKNIPNDGYCSLSMGYPPILGAIGGVNECGLAVSLNHAYAKDEAIGEGVFVSFLVQSCLEQCKNVAEAIELIKNTPVPNGSILTLADSQGERVAAEVCSIKKHFRFSQNSILKSFNKYSVEMEKYEIPLHARGRGPMKGMGVHDHNVGREKRFDQIVRYDHKYSNDDIHQLLSDHDGGEGSAITLCRHHRQTGSTLISAILDPISKEIRIIFGFACLGNYQVYRLGDDS